MESRKEQIRAMAEKLPENCTFADAHYQLFVLENIRKGIESAEREPTYSQAEIEQQFAKWLK